jgi:hypothetical protein
VLITAGQAWRATGDDERTYHGGLPLERDRQMCSVLAQVGRELQRRRGALDQDERDGVGGVGIRHGDALVLERLPHPLQCAVV